MQHLEKKTPQCNKCHSKTFSVAETNSHSWDPQTVETDTCTILYCLGDWYLTSNNSCLWKKGPKLLLFFKKLNGSWKWGMEDMD